MDNKENKKPAEELTDEALDDVSGGGLGPLSTPGILSPEQMDELFQQKSGDDPGDIKIEMNTFTFL